MTEYLAADSGGYLCTDSLRALITPLLDASPRTRDGIQWTGLLGSKVQTTLVSPKDWVVQYIRTYLLTFKIMFS